MQLPLKDAKRCIRLFSGLDMFALETSNVFKKGQTIVADSINEVRLEARLVWQNDSTFIERFIRSKKKLSEEDINLLRSWKGITRSTFVISKYYPQYAAFISLEDGSVYGVLALTDSFKEILPKNPPITVETSLFPYNGRIIWDGLVSISMVSFDKNLTSATNNELETIKKNGKIILQLSNRSLQKKEETKNLYSRFKDFFIRNLP